MSVASEVREPGWAIALKSSPYECHEMSDLLDDADIENRVQDYETGALLLVRSADVAPAQALIQRRRDRREQRIARYIRATWSNKPVMLLHGVGLLLSVLLFVLAVSRSTPFALKSLSLIAIAFVWWGVRKVQAARLRR
ncbi:MAG: hypothetical protein QNJ98_15895 [Planctomycetota bacterium]|nr:hypothetical protein [Planctomycetota bacterium]